MYEFELNLWKAGIGLSSFQTMIRCRVKPARILTDSDGSGPHP
jgi:hypothetical protein